MSKLDFFVICATCPFFEKVLDNPGGIVYNGQKINSLEVAVMWGVGVYD